MTMTMVDSPLLRTTQGSQMDHWNGSGPLDVLGQLTRPDTPPILTSR